MTDYGASTPFAQAVQIDDPELRAAFAKGPFISIPQTEALGIKFLKLEHGKAWTKVAWREDLVGDSDTGVIAGGVLTTTLDHTCGGAVQAALGKFLPMVTLDLRIDYMRPAEPRREIFCMAHCYKVTRSICFVRGWAYHDSEDDPIATASGAFILLGEEHKGYDVEAAGPHASGIA
ncbi:MAG: PaaI family thioesterase [Caulobacterales bacterium]